MARTPEMVTEVRIQPSVIQVCLSRISWSWNRKKLIRFPMTLEDMFIAQKIPELLVIVSSSELFERNVPCKLSWSCY